MRVFQEPKKELLRRCWNLQGFTYKVLHYLEAVATWRNLIPTPVELAKDLGAQRTHLYRAYAELKNAGVIIEADGRYYLHPSYCWKGNEQQLEEAYKTVFAFLRMEAPKKLAGAIAEGRATYSTRGHDDREEVQQ